jgi:hypothetical protein
MIKPVYPWMFHGQTWSVIADSKSTQQPLAHGRFTDNSSICTTIVSIPLDTFQYSLVAGSSKRVIDRTVVWTPEISLRISEIFPRSSSSEPEWIELVNVSAVPVNLKGWYFGFGSDTLLISSTDFFLKKAAFCILTSDKKSMLQKHTELPACIQPRQWYTLNNQQDSLSLFTPFGQSVDTAVYDADWFNGTWSTQSIERVDPPGSAITSTAWGVSKQSTPCRPNSIHSLKNTGISLDVGPIPFTPDNDGIDDLFMIRCSVPMSSKNVTLSIVAFNGRVVKTFNGSPSPVYLWDGIDNKGKRVENGPFFVIVSFSENGTGSTLRKRGVLWR